MSTVLINQQILIDILGNQAEGSTMIVAFWLKPQKTEGKALNVGKDFLGLLPGGVTTAQE